MSRLLLTIMILLFSGLKNVSAVQQHDDDYIELFDCPVVGSDCVMPHVSVSTMHTDHNTGRPATQERDTLVLRDVVGVLVINRY